MLLVFLALPQCLSLGVTDKKNQHLEGWGVAGAALVGCVAVSPPCSAGSTNRQLFDGQVVCWGTACRAPLPPAALAVGVCG